MQGLHRRILPCGGVGTDSGPLPELWRERPDLYDYSLRGARLLMPTWGCESAPGGAGKVRADRIQRGCRALLRLGPTHLQGLTKPKYSHRLALARRLPWCRH